MWAVTSGRMFGRRMLHYYSHYQQNPDNAKNDQSEQSHYQDWHNYTSLLRLSLRVA